METVKVKESDFDIIELFEHHALVQMRPDGGIFLIEYQNILPETDEVKYGDSNLISIRGYKQWPKKIKKK